jgi:E3 SUMO-protein ligase PIAS1
VENILKNTPDSVDQVTVQPDGKWQLHNKKENVQQSNGFASDDDDDDDLVEITKNGDSVLMGTPQPYGTPNGSYNQRSTSTPSGMQGSISSKRPISAVIDLTSSGDEDEEPISRTPKRQHTNGYPAPSSFPIYRSQPSSGYRP